MLVGKHGVVVLVGDFTRPSRPTQIKASVVIHNRYYDSNGGSPYDIALLTLSRSVERSRVIPLCSRSYESSTLAVCGMGLMRGGRDPSVLQEVRLQEMSKSQCYVRRGWDEGIQICAGSPGRNKDSCGGDSGGPLFPLTSRGAECVYGVVSYGDSNCLAGGIYTRVSAFRDWIESQMQRGGGGGGFPWDY